MVEKTCAACDSKTYIGIRSKIGLSNSRPRSSHRPFLAEGIRVILGLKYPRTLFRLGTSAKKTSF